MNDESQPYREELAAAVAASTEAGHVVREYYAGATTATYAKGDGSPVTDADLAADAVIREVLGERFPTDPILSEEGQDDALRLASKRCWIVDPIDGTEQFILRTGEFDVLVGLVVFGRPVAVAGFQPATGVLVTATHGGGAWVRDGNNAPRRFCLEAASDPIRLATSKWFGSPENAGIVRSVAGRLGTDPIEPAVTGFSPRIFLAPRALDAMIGVRPGTDQTMASEWDFVVADLVIHEAGGLVTDLAGRPFRYNKRVPHNLGGMIAAADPATHQRVRLALEEVRR